MDIGILDYDTRTPATTIEGALAAERNGLASYWVPGGWRDPLTLIAVASQHAHRIEFASSIVSVYAAHPTAVAEQALTVNAAASGRLVLGIGSSHPHMVEGRFGGTFDKPIRYLREYLQILRSLFDTGAVDQTGEVLSAHTELRIVDAQAPQVLVAALSDLSLKVAGRLADGTTATWLAPEAVASHTVPIISAAAEAADRPAPRIAVSLPVCVTNDREAGLARAEADYGVYVTRYTAYARTFARQGVRGPVDVVVVGDEDEVAKHLARFADAGATDFVVNPFGTPEEKARTVALAASLAATA